MAGSITKPLGTVILKTTCAAGSEKFNTASFVVKEITIVGSRSVRRHAEIMPYSDRAWTGTGPVPIQRQSMCTGTGTAPVVVWKRPCNIMEASLLGSGPVDVKCRPVSLYYGCSWIVVKMTGNLKQVTSRKLSQSTQYDCHYKRVSFQNSRVFHN